jgi:hypothetical protein
MRMRLAATIKKSKAMATTTAITTVTINTKAAGIRATAAATRVCAPALLAGRLT